MKKIVQSGFTLIELIVVIVILGVLAAFALPRFADLDVEARKAVTEGLAGSLRAASALTHGVALATRNNTAISLEGVSVTLTNKYPSTAQISRTIADLSGFNSTTVGSATRFVNTGVTNANSTSCMVEYTEPAGAGQSPTITIDVSNCS